MHIIGGVLGLTTPIAYVTVATTIALAVARPRLGTWRLGAHHAALAGTLVLLATGVVHPTALLDSAADLWRPFITITAVMAITAAARSVRLFSALAHHAFGTPNATARTLFTRVFLFAAATSSVLNNDAMVLLATPLVLDMARERFPNRTDLYPAMAFAVFAAVGVAPLVVSNPMNMIVADYAAIDFNAYASWMIPIAVVGWVIAYGALRLLFRAPLSSPETAAPTRAGEPLSGRQRWILVVGGLVVVAYPVVAAIDGPSIWIPALAGAIAAILLAGRRPGRGRLHVLTHGVAWDVLVFLFAVFVMATGLRNVGFVDHLAALYDGASLPLIGSAAALGSALLNNHPMAILNLLALEQLPDAGQPAMLAMLIGGDLGPRLLPVGSLAGLLWLDACRRHGVHIGVGTFFRVGVVVTVPTLAASLAILWLRASM